jgi:ribosomal protein L19
MENKIINVGLSKHYTKPGDAVCYEERPEGDQKDITEEYSISHPNEVLKLCVTADEIEPLLAKFNFANNKGISVTPCTIGKFYDITKYTEFVSSKEVSEDTLDTRGYILADPSNPNMVTWVPEEDINNHLTEISTPATQIKQVLVKEMTRGNYNEFKGWIIPENENPLDEGFLLKDPDSNYITWVPKDIFEKTVTVESPLIDTAILMKSDDFKDRFRAEFYQLSIRYEGLQKMVTAYENNQLSFIPKCSIEILKSQLDVMKKYIEILEERAKIENILL